MALRYQTGTATITQFIVMMLLTFANGIYNIVSQCVAHNQCVENTVSSALYILLMAVWLMFLSVLGYAAQDKRSRPISRVLIGAEALVAIVALFNARHFPNLLGLATSLVDCGLAIWVIVLAWRINRASGGRIVANTSNRQRQRKHTLPVDPK
ncbi:MAG TPA: hypothetical protein VF261_02445 [Candidatus Saccharimonadales bacterium]